MTTIDRDSKETLLLPVSATLFSGSAADLTADEVQVAVVPNGQRPQDGDWVSCDWSSARIGNVLVPWNLPGGFQGLAPGQYGVWVRVTDAPDVPQLLSEELLYVA